MWIGLAGLPLCWAVSLAVFELYQQAVEIPGGDDWKAWAFPIGFVGQALIFFILPRATRTYVLGHELTHALWALMMGGRVGKMKVGKEGGHVEVSKTNFLITLAPYFFPFYTVLVIAAYYLAGFFADMAPYLAWWMMAVGFTWSFHVTFTIHMLTEKQPDVKEHGWLFSHVVIYVINLLVVGVWIVFIGAPRFADFGAALAEKTTGIYATVFTWGLAAWRFVEGWMENRG